MRDDLEPVNQLLKGEKPEEWLQYNSRDKLEALKQHEEAMQQVQTYFEAYMMAYGVEHEHLVNPETKYDTERL